MPAKFVAFSPNNASTHRRQHRGISRSSLTPQKRSQVSRACDWCRVHRTKCDNSYPCQNCQNRAGHCTRRDQNKTRTLPSAVREIERLEARVRELEGQLGNTAKPAINDVPASVSTSPALQVPVASVKVREGTYTYAGTSPQSQWYGLLSNFYFSARLRTYLTVALDRPYLDDHIQPHSASKTFISPISTKDASEESNLIADLGTSGSFLTGMQEDYFLSLFWESHHCTLQILDEGEFREHYRSLWKTPTSSRKPSALVDIILAVCMQYGLAFLPREYGNGSSENKTAVLDGNDATIAGRWYYRRSQMLLNSQLENPSIMTVQCHIFTVLYLCSASYQNMSYSVLAMAVRTAHLLGLHLEPPEDLPRERRELRKRLWWTLYYLECKNCMKLGRPWCAPFELITCQLPADDRELALMSGSNFASYGEDLTWLTYTLQMTKLILATRTVYVAFSDKCADIATVSSGCSLYKDPQTLEACAVYLSSQMDVIQGWRNQVPEALKIKRKTPGISFSTERTMLNVELYAPLWLQRQRLMLELFHHNLCMNLYRPFICFPLTFPLEKPIYPSVSSPSQTSAFSGFTSCPTAERLASSSLDHAIAITRIMHQILTSSEILSGFHETFHWQWNATITLIGYILAYPLSQLAIEARDTTNSAIIVFETFGNHFAVGASAANVTRNLLAKADFLRARTTARSVDLSMQQSDNPDTIPWHQRIMGIDNVDLSVQSHDIRALESFPRSGTTDLSFSFDSLDDFEHLFSGSGNPIDAWALS